MMDHLAEAKVRIYRSEGDIGHTYAQLHAIRAIAHALIAIAERLDSGAPLRINLVGIDTSLDAMAATYNPDAAVGSAQNATDATPDRPTPDATAP